MVKLPYVGDAIALVAAVLLRLVWLVAELAMLGVLSLREMKNERLREGASESARPERDAAMRPLNRFDSDH